MAFQLPLSLPVQSTINSASEVLPAVSSVVSTPFKYLRPTGIKSQRTSRWKKDGDVKKEDEINVLSKIDIPECLQSLPASALRVAAPQSALEVDHDYSAQTLILAGYNVTSAQNHVSRRNPPKGRIRHYTTTTAWPPLSRLRPIPNKFRIPPEIQRRTYLGGQARNQLAQLELVANNNSSSPTAQNNFYRALLRYGMPEIVVERYQTGRYSSDDACEETYQKALTQITSPQGQQQPSFVQLGGNRLSPAQLQSVAQAAAAQQNGGDIAYARPVSGSGEQNAPIYVVVAESTHSKIYKWVRFLMIWGLAAFASYVIIGVLVDTTGVIKKVGIMQNNAEQQQKQTVRFSDVQGVDEAKDELQELVEFLTNPDRFSSLGGKLPKGVLLVGPPGTGKTLLARAVAGEAGVPFFYMSGSEFDEVYVGVGAKRVRELFNQARAKAPAIIFIDELDAIGGKRNERDQAYVKQTLNQLLTELDGFSPSSGVVIIAATNHPQLLDKALTRPGRFDRHVVVPLPDVRGRIAILKHHMKPVKIAADVDASIIARATPGFSGADLENLVNQAAVHASRNKQNRVTSIDFEWAKDRIMMGAEARSRIIPDKDKLSTAYHEVGHTLVALYTKGATPLYKATIIPRGQALGITFQLPEMDQYSKTYTQYLADLDVALGGRCAEELIYGPENVTSGISNDLRQATDIAHLLVTRCGFSPALGNVDLASDYEHLSSETKQLVEEEVRRIIEEARQRATKLLAARKTEVERLAKALVEYETLTKDEIERIVRGEKLERTPIPKDTPIKLPDVILPAELGGTPGGKAAAGKAGRNTAVSANIGEGSV